MNKTTPDEKLNVSKDIKMSLKNKKSFPKVTLKDIWRNGLCKSDGLFTMTDAFKAMNLKPVKTMAYLVEIGVLKVLWSGNYPVTKYISRKYFYVKYGGLYDKGHAYLTEKGINWLKNELCI